MERTTEDLLVETLTILELEFKQYEERGLSQVTSGLFTALLAAIEAEIEIQRRNYSAN